MQSKRVTARYQALLAERDFQSDAAQLAAAARLDQLFDDLTRFKQARDGLLKRLFKKVQVPRGLWMYGGVGRGKSFLMDCFYGVVPVRRKTRIHFHEFMRSVHLELEQIKGQSDPLDLVAKNIAQRYRLICFDEFHVSDIADAMILERLLRGLFDAGVVLVVTSNYQPDGLYPEGLHRDRILPAIGLLNTNLDVMSVDAGVDYRQMSLAQLDTYHSPLDDSAEHALSNAFDSLAEVAQEDPDLVIQNRPVRARKRAGGIVWFDFDQLCGGPRSQNDYLEVAQRFHTVILSGVPRMDKTMASEARRFVWLIDVLYDQRVTVLIAADCEPEQLYASGPMANEFTRTASRLREMQSKQYLEAPRRGVARLL